MDDKWAFLRPWRDVLHECKNVHDSLETSNSRAFRALNLPVHASMRCWPSLPKGYQALGGRCSIPIPFRANAAIRSDVVQLQRIREAMELFNVLATVSRAAFLELLAEFVVVADNFDDLFTPDYIFVFPIWECYLVGKLDSKDVVVHETTVTWGKLFGCSSEMVTDSTEFQDAMDKLEVMRKQVTGALCDFMGRRETDEWGSASSVMEWTAEHVSIPTKGAQVSEDDMTDDSFSFKLRKLFEIEVPSVVQLCAVEDGAKLLSRWEYAPPNVVPQTVEALKPMFSASGAAQLTNALAVMNLKTFRLYLDEAIDVMEPGKALTNAGFMLSTLVCGASMCEPPHDNQSSASIRRTNTIGDLQVTFASHSVAHPAGLCSAIAESSSVEGLTLRMGAIGDRIPSLNQYRWGWLSYAMWSSTSNCSLRTAKITNIHLSTSTIDSVAEALSRNFPPAELQSQHTVYGYVDVQEGTEVRLSGVENNDNSLVIFQSCRCRARRIEGGASDLADVVLPGYGLCQLKSGNDINTFVPDEPTSSPFQTDQSGCLRSLSLEFFEIENYELVPSLLALIGKNLRSLSLGMFWTGRRRQIVLDDIAAACPHLEELSLANFEVIISSKEVLRSWGIKKLSIQSAEEVAGLGDCLSDPAFRISRELEELTVNLPRSMRNAAGYADSLRAHNDDYVAVTKEKLPIRSKTAMISVVDGKHTNQVEAVHCLNEILMNFIFAFAATPKRRSVQVNFL